MKSTRRQDYISKVDIFRGFINRASALQYARTIRKQRNLEKEIIEDRKAEDVDKAIDS